MRVEGYRVGVERVRLDVAQCRSAPDRRAVVQERQVHLTDKKKKKYTHTCPQQQHQRDKREAGRQAGKYYKAGREQHQSNEEAKPYGCRKHNARTTKSAQTMQERLQTMKFTRATFNSLSLLFL